MDERLDDSVGEQPSPRRGRPRKTVPDGARIQAVPEVCPDAGGQREDSDRSSHSVSFEQLEKLAESLSDAGQVVTQIHHLGQGREWSYWGVGCTTISNADADCVVTTDGKRHTVTG